VSQRIFNEPKLLKTLLHNPPFVKRVEPADLQRAEIAETGGIPHVYRGSIASQRIFNEPKLLKPL